VVSYYLFLRDETLLLIGCIEIKFKRWFTFEIYRRTVVSIPSGPSALAVKEAAWGLARYAAISQVFPRSMNVRLFVEMRSSLE
jgi:hypothetical protein